MTVLRSIALTAVLTLVGLSIPFLALAQTESTQSDAQLRATIRAQLLSDPRTAGLSQAELDAMVDLLAKGAEEQNVSSKDLEWHPQPVQASQNGAAAAPDECAGIPSFLCSLSKAFGFVGAAIGIAIALGLAAMVLIWLIAHFMHHGHPTLIPKSPQFSTSPPPTINPPTPPAA